MTEKSTGKGEMAAKGAGSLTELIQSQAPDAMRDIMSTLSSATAESQSLMGEFSRFSSNALPHAVDPMQMKAAESFAAVGQSLAMHPDRLMRANMELFEGYAQLWQNLATGQLNAVSGDRRFSDPEWSSNPFFYMLQRSYELNTRWLMSLVDQASDVKPADKRKAKFYTQQTVDALAPTNFFATNPAALRAFIESRGASVLEGIRQAREDIARSNGRLSIQQVDSEPFQVGENIATAPGKVVYRNTLIEILQFEPVRKKAHEIPLLIFPPFINKYYILDLRESNSMIRWLVSKGFTVFVVSWRSADDETKNYDWDDYIEDGIHAAVDKVLEITGQERLNTVGYCIGGTLLSTALARMCKHGDERISSVTFFASQSDFEEAGELLIFSDETAIEHISSIIEQAGGLMPGEIMSETFNYLRPVDLVWRYVVDNYMLGRKPQPFDLLFWNADQTNLPGPLHLRYLRELYSENKFSLGRFKVLGEPVGVADITTPVFIQSSRADHIVPYQSCYRMAKRLSGPVKFVMAGSGHIAGVINHPDAKKYQHWVRNDLPETPDEWLEGAEERPGSWWPEWADWLKQFSGRKVDAIHPADAGLGDAPGTYVGETLSEIARRRKLTASS